MAQLTGKTVLITGASSGLGEQLAFAAAARGANVVLVARRKERLMRVADQCRILSAGAQALAVTGDLNHVTAIEHVFDVVDQNFKQLDVVINAAGFGYMVNATEMDPAMIARMFRVNTLATMYISQLAARRMRQQASGEIVNIASIAGKIATPKSAVYAATKAALIAYDNSLRLELRANHVNVMTVNPGPIKTDFFETADPSGHYLDRVEKLALDPIRLAELIVSQLGRRRREINRPRLMAVANIGYQLAPRVGDWLTGSVFNFK